MPRFGQPGAPPRGPGRGPRSDYVAPPDDGAPEQLQVMRHVYSNEKFYDQTDAHRKMRRLREKDVYRFFARLVALEAEHRASRAPRRPA
jgi:hypothetical protein